MDNPVKVRMSAAASVKTDDLCRSHITHPPGNMDADISGAQNGEFVIPNRADGQLIGLSCGGK